MRLNILGMEGPFPGPDGGTSGYFLTGKDFNLQLDMGSGTLARLTAMTAPENLTALVLSHWHEDHTCDVLPLLFRLAAVGMPRKLPIYAPMDENSLVRRTVEKSPFAELHTVEPGDIVTLDAGVKLEFFHANHPVPAVMTRISAEGKTLCYTGDTNEAEELEKFASGADLLLCDGLFTEEDWAPAKPHLSAKKAAALGKISGVKQLVITHLNPFVDKSQLLREAREEYPSVRLAKIRDTYIL